MVAKRLTQMILNLLVAPRVEGTEIYVARLFSDLNVVKQVSWFGTTTDESMSYF